MDGAMKSSGGYTIVEAMVTVTLIILLTALGMPALGKWRARQDAVDATIRMYRLLKGIQMRAYGERSVYGLTWSEDPFRSVAVRRDTTGDGVVSDDDQIERRPDVGSVPWRSIGGLSLTFDEHGVSDADVVFYLTRPAPSGVPDCVSIKGNVIYRGKWNGSRCQVL